MNVPSGERNQPLPRPAAPVGTAETDIYIQNFDDADDCPSEVSINFISIDQAGTLKAYTRPSRSDSWYPVDFGAGGVAQFPKAVTASSAGFDDRHVISGIGGYPCLRITFTPSLALATWKVSVSRLW